MSTKTFRGQLADTQIKKIRLGTIQGLIGYKIVKFQLIEATPGVGSTESVVQVYTVDPGTASASINFDDPQILAVGFWNTNASTAQFTETVIFDSVKFNQDIFIAHKDVTGSAETINFYLELEQVKLSLDEATVATLKDMRGNYTNQDP